MRGFKDALERRGATTARGCPVAPSGRPRARSAAPASRRAAASQAARRGPVEAARPAACEGRVTGRPRAGGETMAVAVGSIGHEERLSLVDHLEELRGRLIVSLAVLAVGVRVCMWQNHALLSVDQRAARAPDPEAGAGGQRAARRDLHASSRARARSARSCRWSSPRWSARAAAPRRRRARRSRRRAPQLERGDQASLGGTAGRQAGDAGNRRAVHHDDRDRASSSR